MPTSKTPLQETGWKICLEDIYTHNLFECKNPADQRDCRSSHVVSQLSYGGTITNYSQIFIRVKWLTLNRSALSYLSINNHKEVKQMSAFTNLFECKNPADQRDCRSSHKVSQLGRSDWSMIEISTNHTACIGKFLRGTWYFDWLANNSIVI